MGRGVSSYYRTGCLISVLLLNVTFQADKERQEAEELQKEMGLSDQDDSLVMMLQVSSEHIHV